MSTWWLRMAAWRGSSGSLAPAHDAVAVLAAQRGLHARHALIRHALHEADVELDLVPEPGKDWGEAQGWDEPFRVGAWVHLPLDDGALDLEEGQADARLCEGGGRA